MTLVLTLVALTIAGAGALVFVDRLSRSPVWAGWLVLGSVVLETLVDIELVSMHLGQYRVSPTDLVFGAISGAVVLRLLRAKRIESGQWALICLGIVVVLSLVFGVSEGDTEAAFNEFRIYFAWVGTALYFATVAYDAALRSALGQMWFWSGLAMGSIVGLRWLGRITGIDLGVLDATFDAEIRVVNGPATLFVASAAMFLLMSSLEEGEEGIEDRRSVRTVGFILLIVSVLLNRRTVWIALAVGLVMIVIMRRQMGRRHLNFAVTALVFASLMITAFTAATGSESTDAAQAVTDIDTLEWRVGGWVALVEDGIRSPSDVIIGRPFGSGYVRTINGVDIEVGPHNFYLQTFLRSGLIGLAALAWAGRLAASSPSVMGYSQPGSPGRSHLVVLVVMMIVFSFAWTPGPEQALILGLAISYASWQGGANWRGAPHNVPIRGEVLR